MNAAQLLRLWRLVKALCLGSLSVREMAEAIGVNQKTIRRDLIALRKAGLPLKAAVKEFGRKVWRLPRGATPIVK
jgi:predicted DNA-binding transcriptional regulator YafY